MAPEPYAEVVGSPYEVWLAALGADFPDLDAEPGVGWAEFGVNGINNQGTKGVIVNINETLSSFTPAGGTLPVKDWRTDEDHTVQFSVVDTTVEALSQILDDAAITEVAPASGHAGEKKISLVRGVAVKYFALLVRGVSPYDDGSGMVAQFEFSRVCQTGSQGITYLKGTPAECDCEFSIRGNVGVDPATYRAMNAART